MEITRIIYCLETSIEVSLDSSIIESVKVYRNSPEGSGRGSDRGGGLDRGLGLVDDDLGKTGQSQSGKQEAGTRIFHLFYYY